MNMRDLFKEVFWHYEKDYVKKRSRLPWQQNLFFIPLGLAVVVLLIILIQWLVSL